MKIGVSVGSLYPWSIGESGPQRSLEIATKAGLDGLQLLPLRGWTEEGMLCLPKSAVISFETDWRVFFRGGAAALRAWILFGRRSDAARREVSIRKMFPNAFAVDDGPGSLLEVTPENSSSRSIFENHPWGLALDTWHIREEPRITYDPLSFTERLVSLEKIKLIHFQTRRWSEFDSFLKGKPSGAGQLLQVAMRSGSDVIIEVLPHWLFRNPISKLKMLRCRIEDLAEVSAPQPATSLTF